ncbi:MAG: PAS domain-containing hybrid sensor histidine kinase/response regulator [Xanthomonadales bacterium]|nr:PAS domain-containing hybrid sensor histidine kinase/response regulator [Xanthomonadales bacterium]MCE7931032.1 response regulator [Xanthomonadales bacterium PRO6]
MSPGTLLILGAALWVGLLFAAALYGERRPRALARHWGWVYALSLAVYCTSWTFYGTVTQAQRHGWWVPPTFVGTILLYLIAWPLLVRLVEEARARNSTSIADLIASRFGKSAGIGALATGIALVGLTPYIALQLKAVAQSFDLLAGALFGGAPGGWRDSAALAAVLMALFAMLFGTRRTGASARGVVLAMAFESLVKLLALLTVGAYVVFAVHDGPGALIAAARALPPPTPPGSAFLTLVLLGALAMISLPHQFHLAVIECRDARHVRAARWRFPAYLLAISVFLLPLAWAGQLGLSGSAVPSDLYVLGLPLASGAEPLAILAFLGGLSAATGMVVMAALTLAIMVGNHWLAPLLLPRAGGDLRGRVLWQRRAVIAAVLAAAYAYSRLIGASEALADVGAIAFAALAQLAPAVLAALYWPGASRRGVLAGLAAGALLWAYTLLLPALAQGLGHPDWLAAGLFGLGFLRPHALFGLGGLDALTHGVLWSLAANVFALLWVSRHDRERAPAVDAERRLTRAELREVASRLLDAERVAAMTGPATADDDTRPADDKALTEVEHALSALVGAASARLLLDAARRGARGELQAMTQVVGEAREAVSFSHAILDTALANLSQGIAVIDGALNLVAWNQRYEALLGYPPGFLQVGRPVADLFRYNAERGLLGPDPVDEAVQRRLEWLRAGSPYVFERNWPDGTVIEIRGNPIAGGGFVSTYTDISAFRRAERELTVANETLEARVVERTRELLEATDAAERANQAKTRFLAAISHDLLQPLNAANLFTHALAQQLPDPALRPAVQNIASALTSTETLLAGLLDLSRLDAGGLAPRVRAFPARELLDTLTTEFGVMARERGLRLDAVPSRLWLLSDPQLLRRVLQNFVANALRYTQRGHVLIGLRRRLGAAELLVGDTGPGIGQGDRERIFEEFQRLPAGREAAPEGLGLGLAIAARITRLLGHPITLHSIPGRGTLIGVRVPLATPSPLPAIAAVPAPRPIASGHRVLVVDNEPAGLAALATLLQGWGVEVLRASDGAAALAQLQAQDADAWILDYHLDGGDTGLALRARLRAHCGDRPAILVSADHGPGLRQLAVEHEIHLLHKPIKPLALRSLLARLWG